MRRRTAQLQSRAAQDRTGIPTLCYATPRCATRSCGLHSRSPADARMKSTRRTSAMPSSRTCSSTPSPPQPSAAAATAPRTSNGSRRKQTQTALGANGPCRKPQGPSRLEANKASARACVCLRACMNWGACVRVRSVSFVHSQYCSNTAAAAGTCRSRGCLPQPQCCERAATSLWSTKRMSVLRCARDRRCAADAPAGMHRRAALSGDMRTRSTGRFAHNPSGPKRAAAAGE